MNGFKSFGSGTKFRVVIVLAALLSLHHSSTYAQKNIQGGLSFMVGIPKAEFSENVENTGLGGSLFVGYCLQESPLIIGADVGFLIYGRESRREAFSTTIPDVTVNVTNSNNIVLVHFLLRLQPNKGKVQPYFDSFLGASYLFTKTSINSEIDNEEIASSINFSDITFSYGIGGGLHIKVFEPAENQDTGRSISALFLDIRARYLFGREAEYLKEGSIRRDNGSVSYDVHKSRTDLLLLSFGVAVTF